MDESSQLVSLFYLFIYWPEKKKGGKFERAWKIDGKIGLSGSVRMGVSDAALVVIKEWLERVGLKDKLMASWGVCLFNTTESGISHMLSQALWIISIATWIFVGPNLLSYPRAQTCVRYVFLIFGT